MIQEAQWSRTRSRIIYGRVVCLSINSLGYLVLTSLPERLRLLPHLLRGENKDYKDAKFSLEKLRKSTNSIHLDTEKKKHWKPEYFERLKEVYWVRAKEMQYEKDEIGDYHSS